MSSEEPELTAQQRADILLNRTNVALARSQRLIQSWLPARANEAAVSPATASNDDNDEDFKSMSERAGVGSKDAYGDDTGTLAATRRNKLSSNDKLLEQLLGKKAAQQKRRQKERLDAEKNASTVAEKSDTPRQGAQRDAVESDEDEGRAAAFKSRKPKKVANRSDAKVDVTEDTHSSPKKKTSPHGSDSEPESRPQKRRAVSYLDELMSKKAKKKNKTTTG